MSAETKPWVALCFLLVVILAVVLYAEINRASPPVLEACPGTAVAKIVRPSKGVQP